MMPESVSRTGVSRTCAGVLLVLIVLAAAPVVAAGNFSLAVNQSDYYFPLGEEAIVPLQIQNPFGAQQGLLSSTIRQEISTGGFQYASAQTQASTITVPPGNSSLLLNFGSASTPAVFTITLQLSTSEASVVLDGLTIHFIDGASGNAASGSAGARAASSSAASSGLQSTPVRSSAGNSPGHSFPGFSAGPSGSSARQQPSAMRSANTPLSGLQNAQLAQDSAALKQQLQQELAAQRTQEDRLRQTLGNNSAFRQADEALRRRGFRRDQESFQPVSFQSAGTFSLRYRNASGATARLSGRLVNGTLKEFREEGPVQGLGREDLLRTLERDPRFQAYEQQLARQGFARGNASVVFGNRTKVSITYTAPDNRPPARISTELVNNTVERVSLETAVEPHIFPWLLGLLVLAIALFLWRRYATSRSAPEPSVEIRVDEPPGPEAFLRRLDEADALFTAGKEKEAYALVASVLRDSLRAELGVAAELTNEELLALLRKRRRPWKAVQECLERCALVEFARAPVSQQDFHSLVRAARRILTRQPRTS